MDKKPKLLILSNDLKKGGIERIIINSSLYFNDRNYPTDILLFKNIIHYEQVHNKNINIDFIIKSKKKQSIFNVFFNLKKISSIFKRYNIILSHHDFSNYINVIIALIFKTHKSIIVLHTYPKFYLYNQENIVGFVKFIIHKYLQKNIYKFANEIIVISNHLKQYSKIEIKKNSTLIYNPLIKNILIDNKNFNKIKKKFICVGTLTKRKNQIFILNAFNYLNKIEFLKKNNIQLEIIGEGKELNHLKNYTKENNLSEFVKIMENYENIEEIYSDAYCLISASKLEGIPNVFVESLSLNLPIITSDIPAAFELFDDKNTQSNKIDDYKIVDYGIIFNRNNYINLINSIVYLINNHEKYCNIRFNISKKESKFSIENNSEYLKLIDKIYI
jgi:glycosyltransferase involved in cell wall biosynthesis